jgi:hypothetical protein
MICFGQPRKVSGTILCFNQYPVQNVTVKAKKAKTEAVTDEEGKFELEINKNDVIRIKEPVFLEYSRQLSDEDKSLEINLIFKNTGKNVEKAVSSGYLDQKDLEYGIEHLAHENNVFSQFVDVYEAIRYSVPEAIPYVENNRTVFLLRGHTSLLGSNAAIYVVNGVITEDISYIDPVNIISISKLGNQGAALYGSRAANGVISIQIK